ncbi:MULTISPECIES: hypothetical protein, partial [unclassified Thiothrix]|uniref:hypothetical protein n=1 Tax=unclassified Thiothrix TaxID=2636184 RepID=UPI0025EF6DC1
MKKIAVSVSALVLAMGVLSGCGEEKKVEAPKAEAPKQTGMSGMSGMGGMSGMAGQTAPKQEGMAGM